MRHLIEKIASRELPKNVPNLTWRNRDNRVRVNELSSVPSDLNDISFDYRSLMKSSVQYSDPVGHFPFNGWFKYPIMGVFPWKGCIRNCVTCGGSAGFYKQICGKHHPAFRSPQLIADDIAMISKYIKGPIIILDDIRQGGDEYAARVLNRIKE